MLPPHPLAAKKSAKAATEEEDAELEELRRELQSLSSSLAAQKGAKAKAETKVVAWEAKVDTLCAQGDAEQEAWAVACLGKAREKVKEKKHDIVQLERSIRRLEGIVASEAKVKEEVEDEVMEVEVEEMVEETVKEEVEEKVLEEKAVGAGQWLRGFLGTREAGAIQDLPWDPGGGGTPGQAPPGGGGARVVGVATGVARAEVGGDNPPPLRKGGEDV